MPLLLTACVKEIEEVEKPLYPTVGAINARYSVSDSVTVVFAKGNLQYQAVTNTWRFAENQYDVIGEENALVDTFYNGWIDLFGWGTSGFDSLMPYSFNDTNRDFPADTKPLGTPPHPKLANIELRHHNPCHDTPHSQEPILRDASLSHTAP